MFIPYFLFAYLGRDFLEKHDGWNTIIGIGIVLLGFTLLWKPNYIYTLENMQCIPYLVRTSVGILASCFIILLIKKLAKNMADSKFFMFVTYTGKITLGIYMCHDIFYKGMIYVWLKSFFNEGGFFPQLAFAIVVFLLSVSFISVIRKSSFLSLLLLGNK